jgi:hypothetical protein
LAAARLMKTKIGEKEKGKQIQLLALKGAIRLG